MSRSGARFVVQPDLFGPQAQLPQGLRVAPEFIDPQQERALLALAAGLSLAEARYQGYTARMRLRPWPVRVATPGDVITLELPPRSAYAMQGPARWGWQHSVMPVPALRHSITMRTRRIGLSR